MKCATFRISVVISVVELDTVSVWRRLPWTVLCKDSEADPRTAPAGGPALPPQTPGNTEPADVTVAFCRGLN